MTMKGFMQRRGACLVWGIQRLLWPHAEAHAVTWERSAKSRDADPPLEEAEVKKGRSWKLVTVRAAAPI